MRFLVYASGLALALVTRLAAADTPTADAARAAAPPPDDAAAPAQAPPPAETAPPPTDSPPPESSPASDSTLPPETPPPPMAPRIDVVPAPLAMMPIGPTAQPSLATDRSPPPYDALAPSGVVSLGLGGVLALSGAVVFGTKTDGQWCGRGGCVDRPDQLADNTGASLVGAGLGFAVVGAAGLAGGLTVLPGPGERRASTPMMVTGFGFTALSAAGVGLTIAQATTYEPGGVSFSTAWPSLVGSIVSAGLGIPLLVVGADIDTPEEREADRLEALAPRSDRPRSVGLIVAGAVLTSIGGLAGISGTGVAIADAATGGPSYATLLIALPLVGGGGLFTGVGVPLICAGARRGAASPGAPSSSVPASSVPELRVAPTGFTSTWRF
jgi:hypothetical protein